MRRGTVPRRIQSRPSSISRPACCYFCHSAAVGFFHCLDKHHFVPWLPFEQKLYQYLRLSVDHPHDVVFLVIIHT